MRRPAQSYRIPAPVLKSIRGLWGQQAHQVVQDSEDQRANEVNRVQRDQRALEVTQALQDPRAPLDPKDQVVCPFKECLECRVLKEKKERQAFLAHRVSQEALVHQDAMGLQASGDFLERTGPLALQDHQGQLAFPEPLESQGSQEAWDLKVPWGHLVSLEPRESEEKEGTCSLKLWYERWRVRCANSSSRVIWPGTRPSSTRFPASPHQSGPSKGPLENLVDQGHPEPLVNKDPQGRQASLEMQACQGPQENEV